MNIAFCIFDWVNKHFRFRFQLYVLRCEIKIIIVISSLLSTLSFPLLFSIHDKTSVRQLFIVDTDVCVSAGESDIYKCLSSARE